MDDRVEGALIIKEIMSLLHRFPSAVEDLLGEELYERVYDYLDRNLPKEE
jgi:hypothetical protein